MLKEIVVLVSLLGGDSHQVRERAQEDLIKSSVCFNCLYDHYPKQGDPEIRFRLKEILWEKFSKEREDMFSNQEHMYTDDGEYMGVDKVVDVKLMRRKFQGILKYGNE